MEEKNQDSNHHESKKSASEDVNEAVKKAQEKLLEEKPDHKKTGPEDLSKEELMDLLKRAQANLENFRKQTEKRIDEIRDFAKRDAITKFIPILDNFDLAIQGIKDEASKVGMEMIKDQFSYTLEEMGVKVISCDSKFDPIFHEALSKVASEKPEGEIIQVFQNGYMLNDRVIRSARVQVSSGPKEE